MTGSPLNFRPLDANEVVQKIKSAAWVRIEQGVWEWFYPPDPASHFSAACDDYHEGTAAWFFEGSIFKEWESIGSLIWIYGKGMPLLSFAAQLLMVSPIA